MEQKNASFIVFDTVNMDIEIVSEVNPDCHKLLATEEELLEIAEPLAAGKSLAEAVIDMAIWLIAKINLNQCYAEAFWKALPSFLRDFASQPRERIDLRPVRKVPGLTAENLPVFLSRLSYLDNMDRGGRGRIVNSLRAPGIDYVWELALYHPNDLLKFRGFGADSALSLDQALAEKLGENFRSLFNSLKDYLEEVLQRRCDEIPEIRDSSEFQALKGILKPRFFARFVYLKNFYEHSRQHHSHQSDNDFFRTDDLPGQRSNLFHARNALDRLIARYLAEAVKEAVSEV